VSLLNGGRLDPSGNPILERADEKLAHALHTPKPYHPFVTLTFAQSLDGSIAAQASQPLRLSNLSSQTMTHGLRARHDAILVGINTVLSDNPRLTVRLTSGISPRPIIVDSHLRMPLDAKLLDGRTPGPIIATTLNASLAKEKQLNAAGVKVVRLPREADGRVDLHALLAHLAGIGIRSLMVEGGAQIITSFLEQQLVNQLILTICPVLVGGVRAVNPQEPSRPLKLPPLKNVYYHSLEDDMILMADLK
jgi:GTP cyclohydrolase II